MTKNFELLLREISPRDFFVLGPLQTQHIWSWALGLTFPHYLVSVLRFAYLICRFRGPPPCIFNGRVLDAKLSVVMFPAFPFFFTRLSLSPKCYKLFWNSPPFFSEHIRSMKRRVSLSSKWNFVRGKSSRESKKMSFRPSPALVLTNKTFLQIASILFDSWNSSQIK